MHFLSAIKSTNFVVIKKENLVFQNSQFILFFYLSPPRIGTQINANLVTGVSIAITTI